MTEKMFAISTYFKHMASDNKIVGLWILLMVLTVLITSCNTTKPERGSLSGTVELVNDTGNAAFDPVDDSGITVALYETAILDTATVRINNQYPSIGVIIDQETEFDHRLQTAVRTTETDASGSFTLKDIPTGLYNLAIFKTGWGLRYLHNISIETGENSLPQAMQQPRLYPETVLPPALTDPIIFLADHLYRVSANAMIISDAIIQNNSLIAIDPGKKMDFYGAIVCEDSAGFWRVTTSDGLLSTSYDSEPDRYEKVAITGQTGQTLLKNLIFEYSVDGLVVDNKSCAISNSVFRKNLQAVLAAKSDEQNLVSLLITDNPAKGIENNNVANIERSVFLRNYDACRFLEVTGSVENCYFLDNEMALRNLFGEMVIEFNCFDGNEVAIALSASDPLVQKNNFYANGIDVELNKYYIQHSYAYCNPSVTRNNFFGSGIYISLYGEHSMWGDPATIGWGVTQNQHYPSNYFKAANLTTHIYDANYTSTPNDALYVDYMPRSGSPVQLAGIQP